MRNLVKRGEVIDAALLVRDMDDQPERETEDEQARLAELRRELGFQPHEHAHQLTAKDERAKRSAKRVLRLLTANDRDREVQCWREASLDLLRSRGALTGLRGYLDEVQRQLLPLLRRA